MSSISDSLQSSIYIISAHAWGNVPQVEGLLRPQAYSSAEKANNAARELLIRYAEKLNVPVTEKLSQSGSFGQWHYQFDVDENGLYHGFLQGPTSGPMALRMKVWKVEMGASGQNQPDALRPVGERTVPIKPEPLEDDEDDEDAKLGHERPAQAARAKPRGPPKTAINVSTHRKKIPNGIPECLSGLKLLFTGTFETMDRKTSIATAKKYGAEVITKFEDTDYIIVGTRAGPSKLKEINEKELETISEEEFFQILENGIPEEKKERMRNKRLAEEMEGPEGGEEDENEETEEEKPRRRVQRSQRGRDSKRAKR